MLCDLDTFLKQVMWPVHGIRVFPRGHHHTHVHINQVSLFSADLLACNFEGEEKHSGTALQRLSQCYLHNPMSFSCCITWRWKVNNRVQYNHAHFATHRTTGRSNQSALDPCLHQLYLPNTLTCPQKKPLFVSSAIFHIYSCHLYLPRNKIHNEIHIYNWY